MTFEVPSMPKASMLSALLALMSASPVFAADCSDPPGPKAVWRACDKHRAFLREADLSEGDLSGAVLRGSDLLHANFQGANLTGVDLRWANLMFARFAGTRLEGARLDGATWIDGSVCRADSVGRCVTEQIDADPAAARSSDALIGRWYMEAETHEVEIVPCGTPAGKPVLCVRLIRAGWNRTPEDRDLLNPDIGLKDRLVNGLIMVPDLVQQTEGVWGGHIYNPGKGRSFDMRLTILNSRELRARYFFREDGHQNKHDRRWFRER